VAHGVVESGDDDNRLSDEDATAAAECLDFMARRKALMEDARRRAVDAEVECREDGEIFEEGGIDDHSDTEWRNRQDVESETPGVQELKEVSLPIDDCKFDDGSTSTTSGFVDLVLIDHTGTCGELSDWKFGRWPVETADNNLQGISYSLGAFRRWPKLQAIKFFFKQPFLDSISEATFTRAQVPELYLRVQTVVARARGAAERVKQNDWSSARPAIPVCNFCAHLGKCEKVMAMVCKVGAKFYPLEIPAEITPSLVQEPGQTSLGLRLAQVVKIWADAFRTQITNRVLEGRAVLPDGYAITSMSKRELVSAEAFKKVALKYLTEAEYQSALDITFGPVEKMISDHAPRGQKKATIEQFTAELESAGAVKKGDPFSFLRSKPTKT
jgi:hypothetical protein